MDQDLPCRPLTNANTIHHNTSYVNFRRFIYERLGPKSADQSTAHLLAMPQYSSSIFPPIRGYADFRFQMVSALGLVVVLNHICLPYQNRLSKLENCVCSGTISAFPGPLARLCSSSYPSSSYSPWQP